MIKKIINIKNVGKFVNFQAQGSCEFAQSTAIYADNGSGKTTLTQLLKSLRGGNDEKRMIAKKTFGTHIENKMCASVLFDNNEIHTFNKDHWNIKEDNIVVFDSYYIDENVYVISLGNIESGKSGSFAEIVLGKDGITKEMKLLKIRRKLKSLRSQIDRLNCQIKQAKIR